LEKPVSEGTNRRIRREKKRSEGDERRGCEEGMWE
jgi:hypothetical protein